MSTLQAEEDIRQRLGAAQEDTFERLCCELMRREVAGYGGIESSLSALGKSTKGTPDAHVRLPDGRYVAFQFTTQQTDVRSKVMADIAKLASGRCHFRDKIAEVVLCMNTKVGSERALYEAACAEHGWRLEVYSLDTLARLLLRHPELCSHFLRLSIPAHGQHPNDDERLFECGSRVRQVREELGLGTGEFAEVIGCESERALKRMEQSETECPQHLLKTVSELCGVSMAWLKFGKEAPFPADFLTITHLQQDLEKLRDLKPEQLYWCLETRSFTVVLVAQITQYRWQVLDLGMTLDFWRWIEDFRYLPRFRRLIQAIYDEFWRTHGMILPKSSVQALATGQRHPKRLVQSGGRRGPHWAEDIIDIYHEHPSSKNYRKEYGRWFERAQACMRAYDGTVTPPAEQTGGSDARTAEI